MTVLAYVVAAILLWLGYVMIRTAVRRWRSPGAITIFEVLRRFSVEWSKGAVRGILVQGLTSVAFGLMVLCFAIAGLSGGKTGNTAVAHPVFLPPLLTFLVLWLVGTVVCLSIVFFSRPRSLVLPWLRSEPGAFAFWRQQRRERRASRNTRQT